MHQKLTETGRYCVQNNPLLPKSLVELKDTQIVGIAYEEYFLGDKVETYKGADASALLRLPPMKVVKTTWPGGAWSGNMNEENNVPVA